MDFQQNEGELPEYLNSRVQCPECYMSYDEIVHRRITETYCGHHKCRACSMINLFCRQCRVPESSVSDTNTDSAFDPLDPYLQYTDVSFYQQRTADPSVPWTPRFPPRLTAAAAASVKTESKYGQPSANNKPPPRRRFVTEPVPATVTSSSTSSTPPPPQRPEQAARASDPSNGVGVPQGASSQGQEAVSPIKRTRRPISIPKHIIVLEGERPVYRCQVCGKEFGTKANIKYHIWCINTDQPKPFVCKICSKGFITKNHFDYHVRTHTGELPFACPQCGKRFNQRGKVTRHMRIHTGEKPHSCAFCKNKFVTKQALQSHTQVHTGARPHACDSCDKRFSSMSNLKKHALTHTGEKRYQCHECGKVFSLRWTFETHMKNRHQDERAFECTQCEKSFTSNKFLKRHLITHSSEGLIPCPICGKKVRRKANMIRHVETTHNQPKHLARELLVLAINRGANQIPAKVVAATPSQSAIELMESPTILEESTGSSNIQSESAMIQSTDADCPAENEGLGLGRIASSTEVRRIPQKLFGSVQATVFEKTINGGVGAVAEIIPASYPRNDDLMKQHLPGIYLTASRQDQVQYVPQEKQWKQIHESHQTELQFRGSQRQRPTRGYLRKRLGRIPVRLGSRTSQRSLR